MKVCCGFPKYLHMFAELLKIKRFDQINIISYIPQSESKKEVMRHWKANHEENSHTAYTGGGTGGALATSSRITKEAQEQSGKLAVKKQNTQTKRKKESKKQQKDPSFKRQ